MLSARGANKQPSRSCNFVSQSQSTAEIRSLRDQIDSAEAAHHQMRHQLCIAQDTSAFRVGEFSAIAADNIRLTIGRRGRSFDTNDEPEPRWGRAPDFC